MKYVIFENVDRLLASPASCKGRDFAIMLSSLQSLGYAVEWRVVDASSYGFPQRRRRVFIIGYHSSTPAYAQLQLAVLSGNVQRWLTHGGTLGRALPCAPKPGSILSQFALGADALVTQETYTPTQNKSRFQIGGICIGGEVWTQALQADVNDYTPFVGRPTPLTLGDIVAETAEVPEHYFIDPQTLPRWQYLKGGKSVERTAADGSTYFYTEGQMVFPDPLDRPSRTLITSEGGNAPARTKHVVRHHDGRLRRLMPEELEALNGVPRGFTAVPGVSDSRRAFLMGNALVADLFRLIGAGLLQLHAEGLVIAEGVQMPETVYASTVSSGQPRAFAAVPEVVLEAAQGQSMATGTPSVDVPTRPDPLPRAKRRPPRPCRPRESTVDNTSRLALIKAALATTTTSKRAAAQALRAHGLAGNDKNIEQLLVLRAEFEQKHRNRVLLQANRRLSSPLQALPYPTGRSPVLLPKGRLTERLNAKRQFAVKTAAKAAMRFGAPGGTSFRVELTTEPSKVGYSVRLGKDWNVYRGSFKGWAANVDEHSIAVPKDWCIRVQRRGLTNLGGLLTLDALPLESPAGEQLYAAAWARQGRGYSVVTERGYIAISDGVHFHADTPEAALEGLYRKRRTLVEARGHLDPLALSVDAFIQCYLGYGGCQVSVDDARASGSCEYGIRAWCATVGIDMQRGSVPLSELLEAFRRAPQTEVRLAVIRAVRRHRQLQRKASRG